VAEGVLLWWSAAGGWKSDGFQALGWIDIKSGTFSTYICISLAWWFHQKEKLTYFAVAGLWSRLSREFEIHNNLLLFQHLLLLLGCIVTRAIQSAVVISRVEILIVEFSLWCPKELSAIDPFNASLLNVLSHGVF
jgi:uncharacterized membrane protein